MPKHRASEATKAAILDACRTLFFEKGYEDTTYKDIEEATGILPGSIYYHFRKKEEIHRIIFDEVANKMYADATRYANPAKPHQVFMLNNVFTFYKIYQNENFRRFFLQSPMGDTSFEHFVDNFYLFKRYVKDEAAEQYVFSEFNLSLCFGVDSGLGYYMQEHFDTYTREHDYFDTAARELALYAKILGFSETQFQTAMQELMDIISVVDWSGLDFSF